ncbi:hypothetical protein GGS21DRAFT_536750 [Xylaria nigripes]|nr:hypothetical protein GGS21DRAFT_536750 [Xylaria nigripes]
MPHFRGIEVTVHASLEAKQVTEYPHPDGSSVRLLQAISGPDAPPTAEDVDPTRLKKVNPRISVYIPSLPGEQFWLRYLIKQSPPPSRCIFFKMTMNGRHISSWGINTNTCSTGVVVRALYQPSNRWGDESGHNEADYPGIETRYFHFMPGPGEKSAAEDGGVIEVQVFRCKGRKRIALELDSYRNQERYGITSPSGGLVDNPEDATYYNYYLIDAKDAPYATFCFHYRSMKYLKQLNIIPQPEFSTSPASSSSLDVQKERLSGSSRSEAASSLTRRFTFDAAALDSKVFDDNIRTNGTDEPERLESSSQRGYFLKSPPDFSPASLRDHRPSSSNGATEMEHWIEAQLRPLPEIPNSLTRPASASSLRSNCPSLTPSLRQYVESEDFENEEIRLSTAQPMLISSESMQALEIVDTEADDVISFSDYASSPGSTTTSRSPKLPSPAGYIPTTGSVLERQLTQYDSPVAYPSPKTRMSYAGTGSPFGTDQTEPRARGLSLTEAEWLRHTPSPIRQRDQRSGGLGNPPSNFCNKEAAVASNGVQSIARHSNTVQNHVGKPDHTPKGNWI